MQTQQNGAKVARRPKRGPKLPASVLVRNQKITRRVDFYVNNSPVTLVAEVRHDDECKNGHNSFAITGELYEVGGSRHEPSIVHKDGRTLRMTSCGCLHEDIARHIPELAPFIKWHLSSTDEPMHYLANTLYHASDRDHNGRTKGEPIISTETRVKFGEFPITFQVKRAFLQFLQRAAADGGKFDFEILPVAHENREGDNYKFQPKHTFGGFDCKWHECPFDTETEALEFLAALQLWPVSFPEIHTVTGYAEGKAADLDAARSCAVWPDATPEQLRDKDALIARLPAMMREFKKAVESLGMVY